jgi:lipopolysaccharide export LptBFGC system permease protein LptF
MPWTLYRYFLRELVRLLVLTSAVLVTVIAFAAAIKPLADGLLGAEAMVRFVFFSTPTFLSFAVPFAGAFAATLVFLRLASDNELLACSASGMSYHSILLPVAALGLAVTMGMFYLSNWIVPRFYLATAAVIEQDLTRAMVAQLRKGQPVIFRDADAVLYADRAQETKPQPVEGQRIQPSRQVVLEHVMVGQLDNENRIKSNFSAERADAFLYHDGGQSYAVVVLRHFTHYDASRGQFDRRDARLPEATTLPPIKLASPFRDNPKFLGLSELRALGDEPERYDDVREAKRELAQRIASERIVRQLAAAALAGSRGGDITKGTLLQGPTPQETFRVAAPTAKRSPEGMMLLSEADKPVLIEYLRDGLIARRITATSALVVLCQADPEPQLRIELTDARISDPRSRGAVTEHARYELLPTTWPKPMLQPLLQQHDVEDLRQLALGQAFRNVRTIQLAALKLQNDKTALLRKVLAQLHARTAAAIACLLLLILGAVLAMRMRGSMPLAVFFWSCLLAFVTLILINTGAQMAEAANFPIYVGLGLLWSGNLLLLIVAAAVYCVLARN